MTNVMLLIFEGEKTERQIYYTIEKLFFKNERTKTILYTFYRGELFQLWKIIEKTYHGDKDIDIVEIIKERCKEDVLHSINEEDLQNLSRDAITEIHLFFDHDAHSQGDTMELSCYNDIIHTMLTYFNNEYEQGKLWLSYPMVESLKHCKKDAADCFEHCIVDIRENTSYKQLVGTIGEYQDIKKITKATWYYFIAITVQKVYCLIEGTYKEVPDYQEVKNWEPLLIYKKQREQFITPASEVVVISAFPSFLLYYFGESIYQNVTNLHVVKTCQFCCICSRSAHKMYVP